MLFQHFQGDSIVITSLMPRLCYDSVSAPHGLLRLMESKAYGT